MPEPVELENPHLLRSSRKKSVISAIAIVLLALIAFGAWALSSPPGSSPDDDFHLASIWCGVGEREGLCEADTDESRLVPERFGSLFCFAFHAETSAGCQLTGGPESDDQLATWSRGNFDGSYPPVFYAVTGLFASPNIDASVLLIRALNMALGLGLVTATAALSTVRLRWALLLGCALVSVPLAMFFLPSTNPSAWSLFTPAVLFISMTGVIRETVRGKRIGLMIVSAIALLMAAGSRADAAIYAGLALGCALIVSWPQLRASRFQRSTWIIAGAFGIIALMFFLTSSQSSAVSGLERSGSSGSDGFMSIALQVFLDLPNLWLGVFGYGGGLGWLDTAMPPMVWCLASLSFIGAVFQALRSARRRWLVSIIVVGAVIFLLPLYIQARTGTLVGQGVQPRYLLPLFALLAVLALASDCERVGAPLSVPQLVLVVGGLSLANGLALWENLQRYVAGTEYQGWNIDGDIQWWWSSSPLSPMLVLAIGSFAFALFLFFLALRSHGDFSSRAQRMSPASSKLSGSQSVSL